ncbi:MAG TPA: cytidine deaminase [Gammaproteobacteria bacterium]|nr:cytidine deaminase [Gammaproteobacteria bacterium]
MKKILMLLMGGLLVVTSNLTAKTQSTWEQLSKEQQALVDAALLARKAAYAPYSHYHVGAAVRTDAGKIIPGVNVENASYGLTQCAERNAIFGAVGEGHKNFTHIAVVTKDGGTPCGACRQVMNEFNPKMQVIISDEIKQKITLMTVEELLPYSFELKEKG